MQESVTYVPLTLIILVLLLGPYQHSWLREDQARSWLELGFESNHNGIFNRQWEGGMARVEGKLQG